MQQASRLRDCLKAIRGRFATVITSLLFAFYGDMLWLLGFEESKTSLNFINLIFFMNALLGKSIWPEKSPSVIWLTVSWSGRREDYHAKGVRCPKLIHYGLTPFEHLTFIRFPTFWSQTGFVRADDITTSEDRVPIGLLEKHKYKYTSVCSLFRLLWSQWLAVSQRSA